jgi:hypothetical protein
MEIPGKLLITGAVGCIILGAAADSYFNKGGSIDTKIVEHEVIKYRTITKSHETTNPDGSKTVDTIIIDDGEKQRDIDKHIVEKAAAASPKWLAAASSSLNPGLTRVYSVSLDRRLLGPVTVGVYGSTSKEVGLRIGVMF